MKNILIFTTVVTLIASIYFTINRYKWIWRPHSTIVINDGTNYEEIKYAGTIVFNDDETKFKFISSGGFLSYRRNEKKLMVESDPNGGITYKIYDSGKQIAYENGGDKIVKEAIHELIEQGFGAEDRMDRIYKKGGSAALLNAAINMRNDYSKRLYLVRLIDIDSLSADFMYKLVKTAGTLSGDYDKEKVLDRIKPELLQDSTILAAYLMAVDKMGADYEKRQVLNHIIARGGVSADNFSSFQPVINHMGADYEKRQVLNNVFGKQIISPENFPGLITVIDNIGADYDKKTVIENMVDKDTLNAAEWVQLLNLTRHIGADYDKSNLLVKFASKIPADEQVKETYREVAKTIGSDNEYGKAMKALD